MLVLQVDRMVRGTAGVGITIGERQRRPVPKGVGGRLLHFRFGAGVGGQVIEPGQRRTCFTGSTPGPQSRAM